MLDSEEERIEIEFITNELKFYDDGLLEKLIKCYYESMFDMAGKRDYSARYRKIITILRTEWSTRNKGKKLDFSTGDLRSSKTYIE